MPAILVKRDAAPGTPEYDAESMKTPILTFVGIVGGLALLATLLRLYVRQFMLRFTGPDDITMAFAMLCGIIAFGCFCGMAQYGIGRHMTIITLDDMSHIAHWSFFYNLFILASLCLVKVSICLLLIRLVKHRSYVWFLWALLAFLAVYHLACEFAIILACIPIQGSWDPTVRSQAKCIPVSTFVVLGAVNSGINIFTDVLLAVLPIPVIMGLQLTKRTRIALSFVMLMGFIAVGAGAVKLKAQISYFSDEDRYYRSRYPVWAAIEIYFGIIAASLPTLKPLFTKLKSVTRSTSEHTETPRPGTARRRSFRNQEDLLNKSHIKSSTFYSECSTAIATPRPESSKDLSSYFSFLNPSRKQSRSEIKTEGSRHNSVALDTFHRDRQVSLASSNNGRAASPSPSKSSETGIIVRTRKVTTTSEPASAGPTGKRRSASVAGSTRRGMSVGGARVEEAESDGPWVQPLHIRKVSSPNAGMVLRAAMESEEELPRSASVEGLVRGRSWYAA